jgi:hypothetical protein
MDDLRLQDPTATTDHPIDWSDWLQAGETITGADFAIVPDLEAPDTMLSNEDHDDTTTTVTVEGVTFGAMHRLLHTITTSAGRTDTRSLTIRGGSR